MSGSKGKRPTLVADKRVQAKPKPKAKPRARKKPAKQRSRNPIVWLFRLVTRLVWGIGWRVRALVTLAILGDVLF